MQQNEAYATDKLAAHPEIFKRYKETGVGQLITIHLMPQNVCNHSCSFCLVEGTVILTRGEVPIQDVLVGDIAIVGDQQFQITWTGNREADDVYRIKIEGGSELLVTSEHPVFTKEGFLEANELRPGNWVAAEMSLRMRGSVDWKTEPRLYSLGGNQGNRGVPRYDFQCGEGRISNNQSICATPGTRVSEERGQLLSCVSTVPSYHQTEWVSNSSMVVFRGRPIRGLAFRRVLSVERVYGTFRVYNLHCLGGEAFIANGILVHNCSYRLPNNKNSAVFDDRKYIPWDKMVPLLNDFQEMGVQGIEVTGGGEPLVYPHTKQLWEEFTKRPFATALVTNGTMIRDLAPLLTQKMKWARVSIDASNVSTYSTMRKCPGNHFGLAWRAVEELRKNAPKDPEFRLGCGFVLSNENINEVYDFVKLAKDHGADNVRLSSTFSDQHLNYFHDAKRPELKKAVEDSLRAKEDFEDLYFKVNNLIPTRLWETEYPYQDYKRCGTKDFLCVVEGSCDVYTCCTFTGSLSGNYGKFTEHPQGFKGLWNEYTEWRKKFDASEYCNVSCLYRERNLNIIKMLEGDVKEQKCIHKEFI